MAAYIPTSPEPIALIGSACRFADSIISPELLFQIALRSPNLSRPVPKERFHIDGFFHNNGEHHGTTNSRNGYFLGEDHRKFDASFFNITPKEAEAMDPQHRLLLEVVFEALESSGFTMQQYAGQNVGVFVGTMTGDYDTLSARDELNVSQYVATGAARSILSNRISYTFDFHGPSMTIDTACSSSLVALHQAVQSVRSGESVMACVAGVNMMLTPEQFCAESSLHMLSPTGHCRMWDAKADGYARGEGIAAIFVKPLSRALADGDHIQAIIRETGVNSDGRTQGITRPSSSAQTALIRSTYSKTGLDADNPNHQPQFFEAHGTGTPTGDPIEAQAISEAFFSKPSKTQQTHTKADPNKMMVGSIKTIIGHAEGAAGLAGVLKVVKCLEKGLVIPNKHFNSINPQVLPFCKHLQVVNQHMPWPTPAPGHPRRGSVNSFGFGGTNAHAIIEKYEPCIHNAVACNFNHWLPPSQVQKPLALAVFPCLPAQVHQPLGLLKAPRISETLEIALPLVVSAANAESLVSNLRKYNDLLEMDNYQQAAILAWQLYHRQTTHVLRKIVIVNWEDNNKVKHLMLENKDMIRARQLQTGLGPKILGIFTGQGAQYATMSKDLYRISSVYRDTIMALDNFLQACPDQPAWTIKEELFKDKATSKIGVAEISQVTCCALQIALVDFLRSLGISFACVVGHSSGEIAAAYAAGRITKRDAIGISYYRGKYTHLAAGNGGVKGGMAACGMSKMEAEVFCSQPELKGKIGVAASNSPTLVTLSGDLDALKGAIEVLRAGGKFVRQLQVDTAYHSFHMSPAVEAYTKALSISNIQLLQAEQGSQWVSSVSGQSMSVKDELSIEYWGENMRNTVLFQDAVTTAVGHHGPFDGVIEVGPHPALKNPVQEIFKALNHESLLYTGILDRTKKDRFAVAGFLGFMWAHFGPSSVDLRSFLLNSPHPEIAQSRFPVSKLPTYQWDHSQLHWRESRLSSQYHLRTDPPHELLGVRSRDDNAHTMRWRNVLKIEDLPWLAGHKFQGQVLLPASAYCSMAFDAANVVIGQARRSAAAVIELVDLELLSGITIEPDSLGVEILFNLTIQASAESDGRNDDVITADFSLTSCPLKSFSPVGYTMTKNFQGKMPVFFLAPDSPMPTRPSGPRAETMPAKIDAFYRMMDGIGLNYTGPFRSLKTLKRRLNYAAATLDTVHPADTTELSVSPALLDSCFQATFATFSSPGDKALWTSFLPTNIDTIRLYKPASDSWGDALLDEHPSETSVEAYLTSVHPYTQATKATITADLSIYNSKDETWIEVEGMKVTALAPTEPEDDYCLYMTTTMDVDPEQQIVVAEPSDGTVAYEIMESCERVAQYYTKTTQTVHLPVSPPASPIISSVLEQEIEQKDLQMPHIHQERTEMEQFILKSRVSHTLQFICETCERNPESLPEVLDMAAQEAHFLVSFQNHLGRIVQQIAHRYSRMKVLGMTDPRLGFTEAILGGLKESFRWFTLGYGVEKNLHDRMPDADLSRVSVRVLDLEDNAEAQMPENGPYDLVILSTSVFQHHKEPGWSPVPALKKLRSLTREGGFLILINLSRLQSQQQVDIPSTPMDWAEWLEQSNFATYSKNADQAFPLGFGMHIRQARSYFKDIMRLPLTWSPGMVLDKNVLIIGGETELGIKLSSRLNEGLLDQKCESIHIVRTLEKITLVRTHNFTAVIMLADLESPVATNLSSVELDVLKRIMRPDMVILWLSKRGFEDADQAAGFGLTRTLKAEIPNLVLQRLDVAGTETTAELGDLIWETFCRLSYSGRSFQRDAPRAALWSTEPELHYVGGRCLIPRVVRYKPANDRLNAYRRPVTRKVDSGRDAVVLQGLPNGDGSRRDGLSARLVQIAEDTTLASNTRRIRVDYSTSWPIKVGSGFDSPSMYLCAGRDMESGIFTIGLSNLQASIVRVPEEYTRELSTVVGDMKVFFGTLSKVFFAWDLVTTTSTSNLLLVNPDVMVLRSLNKVFRHEFRLHVWTTENTAKYQSVAVGMDVDVTYIHPWTSIGELKRKLPDDHTVRAFIPKASKLWKNLTTLCSGADLGYGSPMSSDISTHLVESSGMETNEDTTGNFNRVVETTIRMMRESMSDKTPPSLTSPSVMVNKRPDRPLDPFTIIDWKGERQLMLPVSPHIQEEPLLRKDRTYLLVGMTRDLGQSLCNLLLEQGARHIVVASRSPNPNATWISEFNFGGADIQVATLDVTDLASVQRLKDSLGQMPRLAGIANGAMILEDGVFANMTIESWKRVMGPKVDGSRNLDIVFGDDDLDFFIMTSSFAAIGGHAGQSAYATANMFMNGLAAGRHARGRAGSVLNIGVIYGLGLLARDDLQHVYDALERDGYPPISERDLHHMFLEAIEAGKPGKTPPGSQLIDLTTGLGRFFANDPNPQHWHQDERFGHQVKYEVVDADSLVDSGDVKASIKDLVDEASSVQDVRRILEGALCARMESILQQPSGSVRGDSSVTELGIDSLAAVEIGKWFYKVVGQNVAVMKIIGSASISELCEDVGQKIMNAR